MRRGGDARQREHSAKYLDDARPNVLHRANSQPGRERLAGGREQTQNIMATYDSGVRWDTPGLRYDQINAPMSTPNRISAVLGNPAVTNILAAIATIRTNLPFLLNLTEAERRDLVKAGQKSQAAVGLGLIFAQQHPEALPTNFDVTEYAKDVALLTPLQTVAAAVEGVNEEIQDTLLALTNDLMLEFLDLYALAKASNRDGRYDSFINSVAPRFARPRRTTTTPPPPGP
jgi:hypothetical protein